VSLFGTKLWGGQAFISALARRMQGVSRDEVSATGSHIEVVAGEMRFESISKIYIAKTRNICEVPNT